MAKTKPTLTVIHGESRQTTERPVAIVVNRKYIASVEGDGEVRIRPSENVEIFEHRDGFLHVEHTQSEVVMTEEQFEEEQNRTHRCGISVGLKQASSLLMERATNSFEQKGEDAYKLRDLSNELADRAEETYGQKDADELLKKSKQEKSGLAACLACGTPLRPGEGIELHGQGLVCNEQCGARFDEKDEEAG